MNITQQGFASVVVAYVNENQTSLDPKQHESQVTDHWTFKAEGRAMSGSLCLVNHGMFDRVYKRTVILPQKWDNFCEQFYSPEARLLVQLYRECQQPSWLTWNPEESGRDDFPMTGNFWTREHQNRTYAALAKQLHGLGLTTQPNRIYADDADVFGVKLSDRVVDFPGSYQVIDLMINELELDVRFQDYDIPRGIRRYGESKPVLHMIGDTIDAGNDELRSLIAKHSSPRPKEQHIVYVFSESRNGRLIARHIGRMLVSVLEIAYGSVAGAIHSDINYIVPNDLSPDETRSYDCSNGNWEMHRDRIIEQCPSISRELSLAA
jgi:hypothetical protein